MIISVMNHSTDISPDELQHAIRAVNRQIDEDFAPYWGQPATLRVETIGKAGGLRAMRGDAVLYLHDVPPASGLGMHDDSVSGIPTGYVFTKLREATRLALPWVSWSVDLSHEALELVADPQLNLLVKGPHPKFRREVFHYREIADPVQSETYDIDGVNVSNFVLPHYYNAQGVRKGRNDFLGNGVDAFRWTDQGYIGFWDPAVGRNGQYVVYPQYGKNEPASKVRRVTGKWARLARYAIKSGNAASR